jgi:hypothetical protein
MGGGWRLVTPCAHDPNSDALPEERPAPSPNGAEQCLAGDRQSTLRTALRALSTTGLPVLLEASSVVTGHCEAWVQLAVR